MTSRSRELRWGPLPKHPLQITMRTPKEPAFKFELLPLHSPLLGQSLLVSFPPLIDMLKFSGYPYPIGVIELQCIAIRSAPVSMGLGFPISLHRNYISHCIKITTTEDI